MTTSTTRQLRIAAVLLLCCCCTSLHAFAPASTTNNRRTTTTTSSTTPPFRLYQAARSSESVLDNILSSVGSSLDGSLPVVASQKSPFTKVSATRSSNTDITTTTKDSDFIGQDDSAAQNPFVSQQQQQQRSFPMPSVDTYTKGFLIIGFITLLNASCNPLWHAASSGAASPPPLLLNAGVAVIALIGLLVSRPFMDASDSATITEEQRSSTNKEHILGGMELGLWKFLGTSAHVVGLSMTTANHGAFLIQLTTLIVPIYEALKGEKIPRQVQMAIALALAGVYIFTQDPASAVQQQQAHTGDLICIAAAIFYSCYDVQIFTWGKRVPRPKLVTIKITTQVVLSLALCAGISGTESMDFINNHVLATAGDSLQSVASSIAHFATTSSLVPVMLWSGLVVNTLATFMQVDGIQIIGPTRAQTIFASQPLWASLLSFWFLGETVGPQGFVGGGAFLVALFLAATAPKPGVEKEAAALVEGVVVDVDTVDSDKTP